MINTRNFRKYRVHGNGELWNLKARKLQGKGAVSITPNIEECRAYRISFHGPGSNSNSIRCIMQHASITDTVLFNTILLGSDHWQHIGVFYLESGTGNTFTIENLAFDKHLGLDVIRFTPLVPKKYVIIDRDSLDFGDVSIEDTTRLNITIRNLGFDESNILDMTHSGDNITIKADFPMVLAPMEKREIPIAFFSQECGEYDDMIMIKTDDPVHSVIYVPVYANAFPYFIVSDNDDPTGYEEFGAQWFTSNATAYGPSSRCAWIQGNSLHADFTITLKYSYTYDIQFIVPVTENAHDHADYIILVDGIPIDTVIVNQNLGSGQFVSIGEYDLPKDIPVTLRIQDNGGNTNTNSNIVLRADAVRFILVQKNVSMIKDLDVGDVFKVFQNYPNPFNPVTHIQYSLSEHADVRLIIYDITGRKIKYWNIQSQKSGWHKIVWDGTNHLQQNVSTGIYIYQMHAGDFIETKKMVFIK
ncbi:T9SS type A sorting domain-containing protein [Bacteroidota bacterium]